MSPPAHSTPGLAGALGVFLVLTLSAPADPAHPNTTGQPRLMQGPVLGAAGPGEMNIWARLNGPYAFSVLVGETTDVLTESSRVTATPENDFTTVVHLTGLKPATTYDYRVLVNGRGPKYFDKKVAMQFHTAPSPDRPGRFTVAFSSCIRSHEDPVQPIWDQVRAARPDLFLWLGDNVYADTTYPQFLAEEYRRQLDVPKLQPLMRSVPQLAIWDDHDYGLNDSDRTSPIREESLAVFRRYWTNPSYGLPDTPGVFFAYRYGNVDFLLLDGRYYRDPDLAPDDADKTMVGAAQFQWLERSLRASRAPFKVIVSGSGWNSFKEGGDSWASYRHERDRLFNFIRDEGITGVVLLSGDTHRGEANAMPWSDHGGYDYPEFVASPLGQDTTAETTISAREPALRVPYGGAPNFGLLDFDCATADPSLTFRLINVYGDSVYDPITVRASQLHNGVSLWRELADPAIQQRYQPR